MQDFIERLADLWIGRYRQPDAAALAEAQRLAPATIVTGASEGIGRAIAERFLASGRTVLMIARRPDSLEQAAAGMPADWRTRAHTLVLDVTDPDAADRIEAALAARGLYADVLVNNAGVGLGGDFVGHSQSEIAYLMDCNMRAPTLLMRHFLPAMLRRGRGGVLNVASLGGFVPGPYQAAYYASKAYLIGLTEAVRWETGGQGVRVCALAPGPTSTDFHERMGADNAFYQWLIPQMSPDSVARSAVRGFAWGRRVILPGATGRILALALNLVPWMVTVPIVGWLLRPRGDAKNA